jgi:uncharacterized membrane protein YhaH (DUF805 family)
MRIWPQSRAGWWGVGGAILSALLFGVNQLVFPMMTQNNDYYAILSAYEATTFVVGLVGSMCTLVALIWWHDDAWAVRLSLLPLIIFIGGLVSLMIPQ